MEFVSTGGNFQELQSRFQNTYARWKVEIYTLQKNTQLHASYFLSLQFHVEKNIHPAIRKSTYV